MCCCKHFDRDSFLIARFNYEQMPTFVSKIHQNPDTERLKTRTKIDYIKKSEI